MTLAKKSPIWLLSSLLLLSLVTNGQSPSKVDIDKWYELAIQLTNKNIDSSFLLANKIDEASHRINFEEGQIKAKIVSGYYYWEKFKLDTAKYLLSESLQYFEENATQKGTLDHGRVWFYLGLISMRLQDLQNAKLCGSNALTIFREINNSKYVGNALNFLGVVQMSLTNYSSSLDYYTQAYKIKLDGGEPIESCLSEISNISTVYSNMGLYDDALKYARQAYTIATKINDANIILSSLNKIGAIISNKGNVDSALFYFNKAKQKSLEVGNTSMAYVSDFNIANTYSNNNRYKQANNIIRHLLSDTHSQRGGMYDGTRALLSKNYFRSGNYDSAILIGRPLYHEIAKRGTKQMAINVTEILWKSFQKKGKYDSAFKYLDKHFTLKDSVYNIENQRKLSSLYAEMESMEKQNEIKILEKEKQLQAIESRNLIIIIISGAAVTILITISIILAYRNREKRQKIKNLQLQDDIEKKKNDLHQQALRIIYINNGLAEIESSLKKLKLNVVDNKTHDIQQLLNTIHVNKSLEKEWENFNEYFGSVHGAFFEKINIRFPDLSTSEKRLASLIKMNLTNREIASILNIENASVKMAKYRLKKKLNLEEEVDILSFLQTLN